MIGRKINLYGGITLAMGFWAFAFIWYKIAYKYLEPMALVFFRLIIASAFLSLIVILTGKIEKIQKKDYRIFLLLAFFEPLLYFIGESYGMTMVSPTTGAVIISFIPLFTPLAAFFAFREKISWPIFAGLTISFLGVLLVLVDKDFNLISPVPGVALMFLSVISAVVYSVILFQLVKKYRIITIIWIQSILGLILICPLFLIFDLKETLAVDWSWEVISPILKLGIFPSSISFLLYSRVIKNIGITTANIFTNFIPVFTAALSFFILKEDMSYGKIIGIILVVCGLIISQRKKKIPVPE
jgi:drug/metabolite transporter (DMT)-like permease